MPDSDEDDITSSDEEILMVQQSKRQKQSGAEFILGKAKVTDDEDSQEEELDYEMDENFIDDEDVTDNENSEIHVRQQLQAARVPNERPTPLQKFVQDIDHLNEDEMDAHFHYDSDEDDTDESKTSDGDEDETDESESSDEDEDEELEPTDRDPKLWLVKCQRGKEKQTVRLLMRNKPPQIISVVSPDNLTDFIYVEAFKEKDVKKAIKGIKSLEKGYHEKLLNYEPLEQMPRVLRVTKTEGNLSNLKPFSWVRLRVSKKPANYEGDLCQVIYNCVKEKKLLLKLIPRVDHITPRWMNKSMAPKKIRQEQKRLDVQQLGLIGKRIDFTDKKFIRFELKWYSREGFLYATFPYKSVEGEVTPSFAEEMEFLDGDDEDLHLAFEVTSGLPGRFVYDGIHVEEERTPVMPPVLQKESAANKVKTNFAASTSQSTGKSTAVSMGQRAPSTSNHHRGGGRGDGRVGGWSNRGYLIGKRVSVTRGNYKSRVGTVKRIVGSTVEVQLDSEIGLRSFDRDHVRVIESVAAGSRTPLYGAMTPRHDDSSTRHYADNGMTRESCGSHSGGTLDPTVSSSVSSTSSPRLFVFGHKNPTSHSSMNSGTTPPLDSSSPLSSFGELGRGTPYGASFGSRTPVHGSPNRHFGGMTHGSRSPTQPSRPWYQATANTSSRTVNANEESANGNVPILGAGIDNRSGRDWYTTGILVQFRQRSKNTNQVGVIRGMSGAVASVFLLSDRRVVTIAGDLLEPVVPDRLDRVKIVRDDERRGETGTLLQVDQQEGRVKMDSSGKEKMFQLSNLCKMPEHRDI